MPYKFIVTPQRLQEFDLDVVMHPPYSPDLEPSDYHIFLASQNFFSDKKLAPEEDCGRSTESISPIRIKITNYRTNSCIFDLNY